MLDTSISRWHPTGLYAAPGEVVTVTVPAELVNQGYRLRINSHSDNISPRDAWERPPVVHRSYLITSTVTEIASAFGGIVFVDLGNSPADIGEVEITLENVVRAPYFDLSQHTDSDWNTGTNWSTGAVPTTTDIIYVPVGTANNLIIDEVVTCSKFIQQIGAVVRIDYNSGGQLRVRIN